MYSLLADQRVEIVGSYQYNLDGNSISNDFIIYVEKAENGDQNTRLLTGIDQGQELSLDQLKNLQFLAAENAYGTTEFTYIVSDSGLNDADNANSIRETVTLDILGFNDTPVLPTDANGNVTITLAPASEDSDYIFTADQLLDVLLTLIFYIIKMGLSVTIPWVMSYLWIVCQSPMDMLLIMAMVLTRSVAMKISMALHTSII